MVASLAHRLEAARRSRFVGRTTERELFYSALAATELPFVVLHLFGPGGVGKSTLLQAFVEIAARAQIAAVVLDGRELEPAPDAFRLALQKALGLAPSQSARETLHRQNGRFVLFVDTYEKLMPLDGWLRDNFLPGLPATALTVLAGRHPPSIEWRTDPGWESLIRLLPLRNLSPTESESYLHKRQIPAGQHTAVLDFTHGHPLALALVADAFAQQPDANFQPEESPDVIQALAARFAENVPSRRHRAVLETCALVRLTTESLLEAMLPPAQATDASRAGVHELFTWLHTLSFVESERGGLFPHDLAREAMTANLRWRNPDKYAERHQRARAYYLDRLSQGDSKAQRQVLFDYIFLHRDNPMVRPYFEWQEGGSVYTDRLRDQDVSTLLALVERHEGAASRQLAAHWLARQPQSAIIFRDRAGALGGALIMVALQDTNQSERAADPAIAAAWRTLHNNAPLRRGESATYFRFWMAADEYQGVSPAQSRIFLNMVQHYLTTPKLAFTFLACAAPEFWASLFAYADLQRLPQADFAVGGRQYGVYSHDWRAAPPAAWLDLLAERETALDPESIKSPTVKTPLLVLSRDEFETAVREVLADFTEPTQLAQNPLLQARLVVDGTGADATKSERIGYLQQLVRETATFLQSSRRGRKAYHALYHAYLQPAASQERAAELLDIPYGTFRRHLKTGVVETTNLLWQQEIGA